MLYHMVITHRSACLARTAVWSDDIIQKELEGSRNKDVFEKISRILTKKGYNRSMERNAEKRVQEGSGQ